MFRRETIEKPAVLFLENLRKKTFHSQPTDADGYTLSDFADVHLSQNELDELVQKIEEN